MPRICCHVAAARDAERASTRVLVPPPKIRVTMPPRTGKAAVPPRGSGRARSAMNISTTKKEVPAVDEDTAAPQAPAGPDEGPIPPRNTTESQVAPNEVLPELVRAPPMRVGTPTGDDPNPPKGSHPSRATDRAAGTHESLSENFNPDNLLYVGSGGDGSRRKAGSRR